MMNIVLIGYRGTGKTSVGEALSRRLGRSFYDTDAYIEEKLGRSISDAVAAKGWAFFRAMEKEAIAEIAAFQHSVIATGGGAVMDKDNVDRLRENSSFVLLTADINTIIERIQRDDRSSGQRPALLNDDIRRETETLLKHRMPVYKQVADFCVDTTNLTIDEVVERIMRRYRGRE